MDCSVLNETIAVSIFGVLLELSLLGGYFLWSGFLLGGCLLRSSLLLGGVLVNHEVHLSHFYGLDSGSPL